MPMNSNSPFGNPWMQRVSEEAANIESFVAFGGNIMEVDRRHVEELKNIAASGSGHRDAERKAAREKLERWANNGSKFATAALGELGLGSHTMTPQQFDAAVKKLHLDSKTKRKVRAMGPSFFKFAAELSTPADKLTQMQLEDLVSRCGREAATNFLAHATDSEAEAINLEFVAQTPDYFKSDSNRALLVDYLGEQYLGYGTTDKEDEDDISTRLLAEGHWTVPNLQAAWEEIKASGDAELPEGTARPLSDDDQAALSIMAATISDASSLDRALTAYVRMTFSDDSLTWQECIQNKAYANVLFDAVFFCWSHKRADYRPSEGAYEYLKDYLGGRFPTFDLFNAGWEECKRETFGRGYVSEAQSIAEEAETTQDEEIDAINARYTLARR